MHVYIIFKIKGSWYYVTMKNLSYFPVGAYLNLINITLSIALNQKHIFIKQSDIRTGVLFCNGILQGKFMQVHINQSI